MIAKIWIAISKWINDDLLSTKNLWFEDPPANLAQSEMKALLRGDSYRSLVEGQLTIRGSQGGDYALIRPTPSYMSDLRHPQLFDLRREQWLCVGLDPAERRQRAWEDEWMGIVLWLWYAEPEVVKMANPLVAQRHPLW